MADRRRSRQAPVVVRVANCKSVSARPSVSRAILVRALTIPGHYGRPHVVLGCEGSDFDAELVAERNGFDAAQFTTSAATAGSFVAWDTDHAHAIGKPRLLFGSAAGEGIQQRDLVQQHLVVNGHRAAFSAGHAPPDRAPRGQASFLDRIRRYQGVLGADFNERHDELEGRFQRRHHGVELLGILTPRRIPYKPIRPLDIGSDHDAGDLLLWPLLLEQRITNQGRTPLPG
jgi:hypothetical protein